MILPRRAVVPLYVLLINIALPLLSCEDVIEVATPAEEPRLTIDALIRVHEDQDQTLVRVKATLTASFFGTIPTTGLTDITISNLGTDPNDSVGFEILTETPEGSGIYQKLIPTTFLTSGELILQLTHEGRLYYASTHYVKSVPVDDLVQGVETFFDKDDTEVIVSFTDSPDEENYYVFDFNFGEYLVTEDTFYEGQSFQFSYFYDDALVPGQQIDIHLLGADLGFYNYMNELILQTQEVIGPFDTPAATVRGNIFDVTDLDNSEVKDNVDQPDKFALGYFAVVEEYSASLTIE